MPATIFGQDSFTDTVGKTLASHVPNVGASWTKHPSYSATAAQISDANRCRSSNGVFQDSVYANGGTPASPDYDVQCDTVALGTPNQDFAGIVGRLDTTVDTCYRLYTVDLTALTASASVQLYKYVGGTSTFLGSWTVAAQSTQTIMLSMRGTSIKGFVGGVERIAAVDNSIVAAGKAGVVNSSSNSDTVGVHIDNFVASDPPPPNSIPDRYFRRLQAVTRSYNW